MIASAFIERHLDSPNDVKVALLIILATVTLAVTSCRGNSPGAQPNPNLKSGKLLALEVSLPDNKYVEEYQRALFFQDLLRRIKALPGVEAAAATSTHPLSDNRQSVRFTTEQMPDEATDSIPAGYNIVSPEFFQTLQSPLIMGRLLTDSDTAEGPRVVVINETLARRFFPDEDPLGKRVQFGELEDQGSLVTIVGVVGDVNRDDGSDPEPEFYISYLQASPPTMTIIVRAAGDAKELAPRVEREVKAVEADVTVSNVATMD